MEQYKIGRATVRVHGAADHERIRAASERFMKRVIAERKKKAAAERRAAQSEGA